MSYSAQSAPAPPGCTPRRSPTPWRSRSPNRTARAPSRSRTQTYRSPVTSPTPGFSRIAQLCGEATAATARDDAAQLSAERRLQVAHQLVGVDDAARGDTEVAVGTNDEHGRVRDIVVAREVTVGVADQGQHVPATSASGAATR